MFFEISYKSEADIGTGQKSSKFMSKDCCLGYLSLNSPLKLRSSFFVRAEKSQENSKNVR